MALSAYRHILRSARIAFTGDPPTLLAARASAREAFERNRGLSDPTEVKDSITHARDVGTILQQNVVQGKLNEESGRYKLNIHEHTERGDNDSIKAPPPIIRGRNTLKNVKVSTL